MTRKLFVELFIVAVAFVTRSAALAQDSLGIVVISPRVGPVIHAGERDHYRLFWDLGRFDSTVVLRNSTGEYFLFVMGLESRGRSLDTTIRCDESGLFRYSEKIDHWEKISDHMYNYGDEPARLTIMKPEFSRIDRTIADHTTNVVDTVLSYRLGDYQGSATSVKSGRKIEVLTRSGGKKTGELLSVRPDEILLYPVPGVQDTLLAEQTGWIQRVPVTDISEVDAAGESRCLEGLGIGLAVGVVGGVIVGLASGDDPPGFLSMTAEGKAFLGSVVFGAAGTLAGGIIGIAASTPDVNISHFRADDVARLKQLARYSVVEPQWLKNVRGIK